MSLITKESFNEIECKNIRKTHEHILNQYVKVYNKNPTDVEYEGYKKQWYVKKAKVQCSKCLCLVRLDGLPKHRQTMKCQKESMKHLKPDETLCII